MKTLKEKNQAVEAVNTLIADLQEKILIAGGGAFLCNEDGSFDHDPSEDAVVDEKVKVQFDVEIWAEHTRTFTDAGRAELASEFDALEKIITAARAFGKVNKVGDGSGSLGSIKCYEIA